MVNIELATLRLVLKTAKAVMDYHYETTGIKTEIHHLHDAALLELEKGVPDVAALDGFLQKMQEIAERQQMGKSFPSGGIVSRSHKGAAVDCAAIDDAEYVINPKKSA